MKNVLNVVKAVVGTKNVHHIIKVADLNESNGQMFFNAAVDFLMEGKAVGIQPLTPTNKKDHIEVASKWAQTINEAVENAMGKPVAPNKPKKEGKGTMKTNYNSLDEWAQATNTFGARNAEVKPIDRAYRNPAVGSFQKHAIEVAAQRLRDFGEFGIEIQGIEWYRAPKVSKAYPNAAPQLGTVTMQLPRGYATTKWINRAAPAGQKIEWHEFGDYMLTQTKSSKSQFNPAPGSGGLTLVIKENKAGEMYVTLPKGEAYTNDAGLTIYPDRLRTRDVRFPNNEPHSGNNANLEAAITAYLRFFYGEFVQANPANRHGIDEHCGTCKFNMYVPGQDQDDRTGTGHINTLNTNDTIEMVQWGQEIPRRYCMVNRVLTDLDVVKDINEALQREETHWIDENNQVRWLRDGELVMQGRGIHRLTAIKEGTAERCSACPHYHNNAPKSDEQIGKEKAAGATYVSKYWSEDARANRMAIQTLVYNGRNHEWVNQYPGEVDAPLEFRVYSVGGLAVQGSPEVSAFAMENGVLSQIPMMEEINQAEMKAAKVTNYIHQACNRFSDVLPDTLSNIFLLISKKPEGISERMERRWKGAVERLAATIEAARENVGE